MATVIGTSRNLIRMLELPLIAFEIAGLLITEKVSEFSWSLTSAFILSFDTRN